MDKLKQLEIYIEEELKRHRLTINDFEVQKSFDFRIKPIDNAELFGLVVCENIHDAAVLANSYLSDHRDYTNRFEEKFKKEAESLKIDPYKPVCIDIQVSF